MRGFAMRDHVRRAERGYNLVEVLIAMALLGTVMLTIMTLFFFGRANVYSGKQMTLATSVATHANEDLSPLTMRELDDAFKVLSTTTMGNNTVAGVTYPNSILRTSDDLTNDANGYLARWIALLPKTRITKGRISLVLMPRDLATSTDPTTARVMQIRIVTEWRERSRQRNVTVDTVKLNRNF
jgi:prepilin-type N-terminal cleavage/methylation domain-containing protein